MNTSKIAHPLSRTWSRCFAAVVSVLVVMLCMLAIACGGSGSGRIQIPDFIVSTLIDAAVSPEGKLTLRKALADAKSGETIVFDVALDGGVIELNIVGEEHSILRGELFVMDTETSKWVFGGFQERDYGASALYANKDVVIDASNLPNGVTLKWSGAVPARVLAVYGNLVMKNVTLMNGESVAVALEGDQPYTLARGGGLAVWGIANINKCSFLNNSVTGDPNGSRDRGAFGGAIYGDVLKLTDCIVAGNSAIGYGGAGGGIYSVGGVNVTANTELNRCVVSGNLVVAQHAYGGGVYSDGGGSGKTKTAILTNCTLARNAVRDNPDIADSSMAQYYYRGGGYYMSNGKLSMTACTVVENEVSGKLATFSGKPNMGGGGIGATIGNAHVVEDMIIGHSVIVGNKLLEHSGEDVLIVPCDLFSGSLLHFFTNGYNLIGCINFVNMLVPVPLWQTLNRKHWPKVGDKSGVDIEEALDLDAIVFHTTTLSKGVEPLSNVPMYYPPTGLALNTLPNSSYRFDYYLCEYLVKEGKTDDFIMIVLNKLRTEYGNILGEDFGLSFGDMTGVTFFGPDVTWPTNAENAEWIAFWRQLDVELDGRLGVAGLNDDFFGSFPSGEIGENIVMTSMRKTSPAIRPQAVDIRGNNRPVGTNCDIGAYERD